MEPALAGGSTQEVIQARGATPAAHSLRGELIASAALGGRRGVVQQTRQTLEGVHVSPGGGVMIVGRLVDEAPRLETISIMAPDWRVTFDGSVMARVPRLDLADHGARFGYLGLVYGGREIQPYGDCQLEFRFQDGLSSSAVVTPRVVDDTELRDIFLSHLADAQQNGALIEAVASLQRGLGDHILRLSGDITNALAHSPYVERFGARQQKYRGSIIVCLYGHPEYHFIQNALFSGKPGIEEYEFIFVSNSPELADTLRGGAIEASRTYGLDQTLVLLPGNAGFAAANNVATKSAQSDRLVFLNPDVFPKDQKWALKHLDLIDTKPVAETTIFGVPLYYDDGSLMHGGMFFEIDRGASFNRSRTAHWQLLRVEHYGKGAPAGAQEFTRPRPVPAVTGAFVSIARDWFESLGGFSEDYIFGHYEDADLCLKSLEAGTPAWMQDLRLWHLEGKGSPHLPAHDGAALVNRWLFSSRWGALVSGQVLGQKPSHALLQARSWPAVSGLVEATLAAEAPGAATASDLPGPGRPTGSRQAPSARKRREGVVS